MAWPMWSWPVTLGGGITMVKGFFAGSRTPLKQPFSSQLA